MSNSPTIESKIGLEWVEKDLFVASDDVGHSIVLDSGLSGKPPKGMGPMKTLLAALGACSGMDVAAILGKRKQKLSSLKIEVKGKRREFGSPKPFTDIHLNYVLSGEKLEERFVKEAVSDSIEKFCSVAATINEKAKLSFSYEIIQS